MAFREWICRVGVLFLALLLTVCSLGTLRQAETAGVLLFLTALLLAFGMAPLGWTRERPLTFSAPLVFASALWFGSEVTAVSVLAAFFLYARFGPQNGYSRADVRFQGAQLALSAFAAEAAMGWVLPLPLRSASPAPTAGLAFTAAVTSALAFATVSALLAALLNLSQYAIIRQPKRLAGHALVYALGITPIVALSPLGTQFGLVALLPLALLLAVCAQMVRLRLEVATMRGQQATAEAMGRASIADPETDLNSTVLLERFLTLAGELVSAERALVWTLDRESGELTPSAGQPKIGVFGEQKALFGEGLIGGAAARFRPSVIPDAARDPRKGRMRGATGSWLLYPIVVHERVLGVAHWIRSSQKPFTKSDAQRLSALVPQAAVALENVRVREEMHNLASTDGLTGLWNHRRMHELLREEMRRAYRYHRPLSLLMMDVDSFKSFNDTYGHPQGDQLLRSIATILHANVRTVDHVGRFGGEEFLVILPETSKDSAYRLAERIRASVEEQAVVVFRGAELRRTISVGVASSPEDALNPTELVQRADEALYRAKREGKNRVYWA